MQMLSLEWKTRKARYAYRRPRTQDLPLRAELFSIDQLVRHGKSLAARHHVTNCRGSILLLDRLRQNEEILRAFNRSSRAAPPNQSLTPAAVWLLDNFYLVEEQIQLAKRHLPRHYSRELPRLADGPSAKLPRVYDIVLELIAHVDAQIENESLHAFITAYQTTEYLKLGELWAIPIMLRLGLIENLQRMTSRLVAAAADRDLAGLWVDRLQEMAENDPSHLVVVVADLATSDPPLSSPFVAEFCQRLSRHSQILHLARNWLEQRLAEQGVSIEQLIQIESQNQAADQVSVSHSISSLRFIGSMEWKGFVEALSSVESTLRTDPAAVYSAMDFDTRDRYRHSVEMFAKFSKLDENEIARQAIQLAEENTSQKGTVDKASHVGFYLIDKGRNLFARRVNANLPRQLMIERCILRFPTIFYIGGIGIVSVLATGVTLHVAKAAGVPRLSLAILASAFLICSSQLALAWMNWLSTLLVKPQRLPRLETILGVPQGCRTMIVIPSMLISDDGIEALIELLEIHYLANRDPLLHFALLTDFGDASEETLPQDVELLRHAREGIELLNRKYASIRTDLFFLFHRPRRWNRKEGV